MPVFFFEKDQLQPNVCCFCRIIQNCFTLFFNINDQLRRKQCLVYLLLQQHQLTYGL